MTPPESLARAAVVADVVRNLTGALAARDGERVAALLADDVVYHFPGSSPLAGSHRGRDAVMAFFRRFPTLLDGPLTTELHDVLASEAHGADLSSFSATRGGRSHNWRAVRIYHLGAADRIVEIFVTIEDQAGFDAFLATPA